MRTVGSVTATHRYLLAPLLLLVLGVSGCSEEERSAAPTPSPSVSPSALAAAQLLRAGELGPEWKEAAAATSSVSETIYDAQLAKCEGREYHQPLAQALGKLLTRADGLAQVSSRARVHVSERVAEAETEGRTSEEGLACAEKQARATARERLAGARLEKLTFEAAPAPEGVDVHTVSELVALGPSGRRAQAYVELLEVRRGALVVSATITSYNQPVSEELRAKVAAALADE